MNIKELRLERGLTAEEFAGSIGIDASSLSAYEEGKSNPEQEVLSAIKKVYGVDLSAPSPSAVEKRSETEPVGEAETAEMAEEQVAAAASEEEAARISAEEETADEAPARAAAEKQAERIAVEERAAEEAARLAAEEEAARLAAEEKAARKAEKKTAKKKKADESAAQWVVEAIMALSDVEGLDDKDAVDAARAAFDNLTYDQEMLVPRDVLVMLQEAEELISAAEEAARAIPIDLCDISVKDLPYTGKKVKQPAVKVRIEGEKLKEGVDYTVRYDKKAREIGVYELTVTGMGNFTGSVDTCFFVVPKDKTLTKLMDDGKQAALNWKELKKNTGYQIEYSLKKDFSNSTRVKIRKAKDLAKTLDKLKTGKKYHMRIRIYTKIDGRKYHSGWSNPATVKT